MDSKSSSWDTCAPEALIRAAGGEITDIFGERRVHRDAAERRPRAGVAGGGVEHLAAPGVRPPSRGRIGRHERAGPRGEIRSRSTQGQAARPLAPHRTHEAWARIEHTQRACRYHDFAVQDADVLEMDVDCISREVRRHEGMAATVWDFPTSTFILKRNLLI